MNAWHRLEPRPDVRGGLGRLRGRFITTALSNGHTALLVDLARHGDVRFDCLLSAELAHAYKPAREVYLTAARLLCLDPSELMMVAAHPGDLKAARRAGLRSAFIQRQLEYGPGSPAREDPDADQSVHDLEQLGGAAGSTGINQSDEQLSSPPRRSGLPRGTPARCSSGCSGRALSRDGRCSAPPRGLDRVHHARWPPSPACRVGGSISRCPRCSRRPSRPPRRSPRAAP